jgi:ribosomal protein RSM22 (predicted rRNA methylase)
VEAGTHAESRRLIEVREALRSAFTPVAPCTHCAGCGLLTPENAPHWCHYFAAPPSSVFQDARWAEWGREMGIDLRRLPYSFLVLERAATPGPAGFSRVIGEPRGGKGHLKVLSCQKEGVEEFVLQKRDAPSLFKELRKVAGTPIYRWKMEAGKIAGGERI